MVYDYLLPTAMVPLGLHLFGRQLPSYDISVNADNKVNALRATAAAAADGPGGF